MNGVEQRERHTVVAKAEKRLDDLEVVVDGMASSHVRDREAVQDQLRQVVDGLNAALQKDHEERQAYIDAGDKKSLTLVYDFLNLGFWRRLRWLVLGY